MIYIASCSFGKDSIATILTAIRHNEPLDRVLFVEVMFDNKRNISGEIPEHIEWVRNFAIPRIESMGIPVDVVISDIDYLTDFFKIRGVKTKHIDRIGKFQGFCGGAYGCRMNSEGKLRPIRKYFNSIKEPYLQYVGIAIDEQNRFHTLNENKISLLVKYNITEQQAFDICKCNNMLSPIYGMEDRCGCWFCHNAKIQRYVSIRNNHPDLWYELKKLSLVPNTVSDKFKYDKTFSDVEREMELFEKRQNQLKIEF